MLKFLLFQVSVYGAILEESAAELKVYTRTAMAASVMLASSGCGLLHGGRFDWSPVIHYFLVTPPLPWWC
jgi:hypothetical protein